MTAKEMQRRNGKAQQLRVIQVDDEGHFFVESSDGRVAYKAMLTNDRAYCACADFNKNSSQDPSFRCKHLFAIQNCLPTGGAEKQEFLKKRQPRLDERFIKTIEGKEFVTYPGLIDLAHQRGLIRMTVEIVQNPTAENGHIAIVKAQAESKLGELFVDVGDATPSNCNSKVAKHLLRMASTRAKVRALRDFTNIGLTALEELGDLNEIALEEQIREKTSHEAPAPKKGKAGKKETLKPATPAYMPATTAKSSEPPVKMSAAQERAILNLAKRRAMNQEELDKLALEAYGTDFTELTVADASQMIRHLQRSA
jgi:hypothetical protein